MSTPSTTPPKSEKRNQHFVPRNWLSRFAGVNGRVLCKRGREISQISVDDIMSGDWIYTVFDEWWRPSDRLEDALANVEGDAGKLFTDLHSSSGIPTDGQWTELTLFLALTACRHPEIMARGHDRSKEMAWAIADVASYENEQAFCEDMMKRFKAEFQPGFYQVLLAKGAEALLVEAQEVENLSPQDPNLPEQLSIEAVFPVSDSITRMSMHLLDAPPNSAFVLGDHPLPTRSTILGFDVPLSKSLAFQCWPSGTGKKPVRERRQATLQEVQDINRRQATRAKAVVIGPDKKTLEAL